MTATTRAKGAVAATLLAGLGLFLLQNREVLQLRFLFWEFEMRRAFMLLAVFATGLVLGWIAATISQLAARGRQAAEVARERARGKASGPGPDRNSHGPDPE